MTDISIILPDFPTSTFAHLIAPLERAGITTAELLCVQPTDVARKAQIPPTGAAKLIDAVVKALHEQLQEQQLQKWQTVSFLDPVLDAAWNGGAPTRYLSEITGESGVGKTQFLLTLLLSVQLPAPQGLDKSALYISTEAALSTSRLAQILESHPQLRDLPASSKPSLSNIHAIQVPDLEAQDHILRYQVPVAIRRFNIGLLVIDSIASNYRAELDVLPSTSSHALFSTSATNASTTSATRPNTSSTHILAERRAHLVRLGTLLRDMAYTHNIAIVVSNQVADRFDQPSAPFITPAQFITTTASSAPQHGLAGATAANINTTSTTATAGAAATTSMSVGTTADPLTLDHQQRWITGWGDRPYDLVLNGPGSGMAGTAGGKTPALGLAWSSQIAARVALVKESGSGNGFDHEVGGGAAGGGGGHKKKRRWMRVVFGAWMGQSDGRGVEYEVVGEGVRAVVAEEEDKTRQKGFMDQ